MNIQESIQITENDLSELKKFLDLTKSKNNEEILKSEIKKLETKLESLKNVLSDSMNKKTTKTYTTITNYSWLQTNSSIKIYLNIQDYPKFNNNPKEIDIVLEDNDKTLIVTFMSYKLKINNLHDELKTNEQSVKITKSNIVINLSKKNHSDWPSLQKKNEEKKPALPEMEDTENPQNMIMGMVKKVFEEGDDKTKQQINKIWYESMQKQKGFEANPFGQDAFK